MTGTQTLLPCTQPHICVLLRASAVLVVTDWHRAPVRTLQPLVPLYMQVSVGGLAADSAACCTSIACLPVGINRISVLCCSPLCLYQVVSPAECVSAAVCSVCTVCAGGVLHCVHQVLSFVCCRCVLPVAQLELLPACEGVQEGAATTAQLRPRCMALDGAALENLEVLERTALCSFVSFPKLSHHPPASLGIPSGCT